MKNKFLNHGRILGLLAVIAFTAVSCEKSFVGENTPAIQSRVTDAISSNSQTCNQDVFDLFAGMSTDVGSVTVANDEENIYVTFTTDAGWFLTETHLYVLDSPAISRLAPGQAPYKSGSLSNSSSFTFTVPFDACGGVVYLQAHAAVVKVNEFGEVIGGETAYGGEITKPRKGSWFGTIDYFVECCEIVEPPVDCVWEGETAFGGSTKGGGSAWWFAFDTEGDAIQPIFAGQKEVEGAYVQFVNGVITIVLGDNMRLDAVNEAVKVEGYDVLPSTRPAAGQFSLYKGNSLTINGDGSRFYVIHLDAEVKYCD